MLSVYIYLWTRGGQRLFLDWSLLSINGIELKFPLFFDSFSMRFGLTVITVSSRVLIFSVSYINLEKHFYRFHLLVVSFVIRIILLIFSPNLISLLLGWDGLGVTSYLLIIYFNSSKSFNAGILTALRNRVGDCLLLVSIGLFLGNFRFNFFLWSSEKELSYLMWLFIWFFGLATITKRAQIPFSAWLPAAIAAPTPVSALVHSSTLVTAGVYLLIRFRLILSHLKKIIFILGLMTMIIAGLSALWETDIKKIVALSTLRQLGLIMTAIGIGAIELAFFHLLSHAFFKALLFITVGNFIHLSRNNQDLRFISLPFNKIGATLCFRLRANIRLIGLPFIRGFYSKDLIIEKSISSRLSALEAMLIILSIGLTVIYTFRFLVYVIWGTLNSVKLNWIQDYDIKIEKGIMLLWPLALCGGCMLSWILIKTPNLLVLPSSLKYLIILTISGFFFVTISQLSCGGGGVRSILSWNLGSLWALPFISSRANVIIFSFGTNSYRKLDHKWRLAPLFIFFSLAKRADTQHQLVFNRYESFLVFTIIFCLFLIY